MGGEPGDRYSTKGKVRYRGRRGELQKGEKRVTSPAGYARKWIPSAGRRFCYPTLFIHDSRGFTPVSRKGGREIL